MGHHSHGGPVLVLPASRSISGAIGSSTAVVFSVFILFLYISIPAITTRS
jgi:hypothetical protein